MQGAGCVWVLEELRAHCAVSSLHAPQAIEEDRNDHESGCPPQRMMYEAVMHAADHR